MAGFTTDLINTPLGEMIIVTDTEGAVRALEWTDLSERMLRLLSRQYKGEHLDLKAGSAPKCVRDSLNSYFAGTLNALDALLTNAQGSAFQKQVWSALRDIPVGSTCSYRDIAVTVENPKGVRAVGLANGANPICIVVPCHRVIGANGSMTGYGGGLHRKEWLLRHESALSSKLI